MSSLSLTRPVDHKEYLRIKYGAGDTSSDKLKKKKRKAIVEISKGTNLRVYDDDVEIQKVKSKKVTDDLDIYFGVNEDKPVVQDIIDDRPTAVKNKEKQGSKWKPLGADYEETTDKNTVDKVKDSRSSRSTKKDSKKVKVKHGITSAAEMREERKKLKEQEAQMFKQLNPEISGKGAKSVYRDKKTGRVRDLEKEEADAKAKKKELEAKTAKERQKFKEMTVGLKQVEEEKKRIEEEEKVMAKPFARYEDDADFDQYCAQQDFADDPMLSYLNKEKEKEQEKLSETDDKKKAKIPWRGSVQAPPNRFNIPPGHRWDGVDRSNGYEQKYFARLAEKEAIKEEAYRWSTEDM